MVIMSTNTLERDLLGRRSRSYVHVVSVISILGVVLKIHMAISMATLSYTVCGTLRFSFFCGLRGYHRVSQHMEARAE